MILKFEDYVNEKLTRKDLDEVEALADKWFSKYGIDIEFTRHFIERANDERNGKDVSKAELIGLFKKTYKKYDKTFSKVEDDMEAVLNDMFSELNMPFVLKAGELISKTIMRKKDFKTSNIKYKL